MRRGRAGCARIETLIRDLPRDGKYKDVNYEVVWLKLPTGAQLNSEILANRLDIVSMADFPSIVGHDAFLTQNNGVKTVYVASLSSGLRGAGNALLVPTNSPVQDVAELKGKTVSVPFASTAHAFCCVRSRIKARIPRGTLQLSLKLQRSGAPLSNQGRSTLTRTSCL